MNSKQITYKLSEITAITSGRLLGDKNSVIEDIAIDSRKFFDGDKYLFVAINGKRHNSHSYIEQIYNMGVRSFIVSEYHEKWSGLKACSFIVVNNTIDALQQLVTYKRKQFDIPVLAITGSNGKTIVKEWLWQALGKKQHVLRSPKSYNSQVGVPLSVWNVNAAYNRAIFEAGISLPGEMVKLEEIIRPTEGIITNVGEAHQGNFESKEQKLKEKLKLFKNCKQLYYCRDHELIHSNVISSQNYSDHQLNDWSMYDKTASVLFHEITSSGTDKCFETAYLGSTYKLNIPFKDAASVENCLHVANYLLHNKFTIAEIQEAINELQVVPMRLEQISGINNSVIINDAYNSDINGIKISLDFLQTQSLSKKTLILSDIEYSPQNRENIYAELASIVNNAPIDRFISIGPELLSSKALFSCKEVMAFNSTTDFIRGLPTIRFSSEAILLKGARNFEFENIVTHLAAKTHTTVLEINLNNLVDNLNYFRGLLKPSTQIMVMVKALSYGSGSYEIANLLQHEKVDYLGVAFADEGVTLRDRGIQTPILVLAPSENDFDRIIEYKLEPEIYNFALLNSFIKKAAEQHLTAYPVHLKVDTGMHRLGFQPSEIDDVLKIVSAQDNIHLKGVFSHLAASDNPNEDAFTKNQIELLDKVFQKTYKALGYKPMRHILNSAGIERHPNAHFEMVRLGIGLHGISSLAKELKNVSTFKSHIVQIKHVEPNETIGYNRRGGAGGGMKLGIIPVGYADGLDRKFGNGNGCVVVNGKKVPFVGDICMDMSMINLNEIDCNEGDEVIIFGEDNPITELALQIQTIPYEILTNVSSRVKRVYIKD